MSVECPNVRKRGIFCFVIRTHIRCQYTALADIVFFLFSIRTFFDIWSDSVAFYEFSFVYVVLFR